jgi:hypothetical protein
MVEGTSTARRGGLRWLPLYLLGLLTVALLVADWKLPLSEGWRTFLLFPLVALICALALVWARRRAPLLAAEGVDARVEQDPILEGLLAQARPAETWEDKETGAAERVAVAPAAVRPARTPA